MGDRLTEEVVIPYKDQLKDQMKERMWKDIIPIDGSRALPTLVRGS